MNCLVGDFSFPRIIKVFTFLKMSKELRWQGTGQSRAEAGLWALELGGQHEAAVSHELGLMVPSFSYLLFFSSYNSTSSLCSFSTSSISQAQLRCLVTTRAIVDLGRAAIGSYILGNMFFKESRRMNSATALVSSWPLCSGTRFSPPHEPFLQIHVTAFPINCGYGRGDGNS